ncbi:hypothetical protein NIES2130_20630 [Scytonema sp. HK-05]|nr:hypothetical protein NIES2130_20630 [Scytonema sp. HK-05]
MRGGFLENCPVFFDKRPHAIRSHARIIELIRYKDLGKAFLLVELSKTFSSIAANAYIHKSKQ